MQITKNKHISFGVSNDDDDDDDDDNDDGDILKD
jgi:hypothetical protein